MMLRMLFVEDKPDSLISIVKEIKRVPDVECVSLWTAPGETRRHATGEELFGAAVKMFDADDMVFDLLCMDIHFANDPYGGIKLYNRMVGEGLRGRWRNVAVLSSFVKQGAHMWDDYFTQDPFDPVALAIAVWAHTAHVPNGNLINRGNARGDVERYAKRLIEIASV